jgi:hypothetical protein
MHFIETNALCYVTKHQIGGHLEVSHFANQIRALNAGFDSELAGGEPRISATCNARLPTKISDGHSASIFTVNRDIVFLRNVVTTYQTARCHKTEEHNVCLSVQLSEGKQTFFFYRFVFC